MVDEQPATPSAGAGASSDGVVGRSPRILKGAGRLFGAVLDVLSPRASLRQTHAAQLIQACARRRLARRKLREMRLQCRLLGLMSNRERKAALLIQRLWRGGVPWGPEAEHALLRIQAVAKGRLQREQLRAERQSIAEAEQAERARLVNECNAVIEKRGRRSFSIGPWDLFVWQERFVSATETALVYQVRRSPVRRRA